jgi:hypothetical protein
MIHHPPGGQREKNCAGASANATQPGHGCHRLLGEQIAGNSLHIIYPTLKTKSHEGDEQRVPVIALSATAAGMPANMNSAPVKITTLRALSAVHPRAMK